MSNQIACYEIKQQNSKQKRQRNEKSAKTTTTIAICGAKRHHDRQTRSLLRSQLSRILHSHSFTTVTYFLRLHSSTQHSIFNQMLLQLLLAIAITCIALQANAQQTILYSAKPNTRLYNLILACNVSFWLFHFSFLFLFRRISQA